MNLKTEIKKHRISILDEEKEVKMQTKTLYIYEKVKQIVWKDEKRHERYVKGKTLRKITPSNSFNGDWEVLAKALTGNNNPLYSVN